MYHLTQCLHKCKRRLVSLPLEILSLPRVLVDHVCQFLINESIYHQVFAGHPQYIHYGHALLSQARNIPRLMYALNMSRQSILSEIDSQASLNWLMYLPSDSEIRLLTTSITKNYSGGANLNQRKCYQYTYDRKQLAPRGVFIHKDNICGLDTISELQLRFLVNYYQRLTTHLVIYRPDLYCNYTAQLIDLFTPPETNWLKLQPAFQP